MSGTARAGRVSHAERGLEIELGGPRLAISVLGSRLLRVRWSPSGEWPPRRPWAVTAPDEAFPVAAFEVAELDRGARLRTDALAATVFGDGSLAIATRAGQDLVREVAPRSWDAEAGLSSWAIDMPPDRRYHGFGERTGLLEKRGRRYTCWTTDEWRHQGPMTDALYLAVPFHLAIDPDGTAHGIFLDTTFRSAFDLRRFQEGRLLMEAETEGLDWYLLYGPKPAEVLAQLADLTGHAPLPPRWALGYHQARWSYGSADEVLEVARQLRAHRIPADAIHLDIDHMDRFRPFTWDPDQFPDPAAVTAELDRLGLRTTVVVDAALPRDPDYAAYADGRRRGAFVRESRDSDADEVTGYVWGGRSVIPDHARPEVRRWWGDLHRGYVDSGIAGFLNDMNEPAMHDRPIDAPGSQNSEPAPDTPFGEPELGATHAEVRNVYGSLMSGATSAYLRRAQPGRRPFVVSRAGFAGIQREAIVWTGDNWSFWEHLEMSLAQLLNLGLSGIPLAGADIGGFFESCTPELLVRWYQLGAFYPFARNNSAHDTARQEPWVWGEPTTSRCRRAIELRYRLLPYLYTAVEQATRTGLPILRPLFMSYPEDAGSVHAEDVALFGPDLLIAPVVRPGLASRQLYLPPGDWTDTRTGQRFAGGRIVTASAGLDEAIPLFARAGSIVPMAPVVTSTRDRPERLELHVYPGAAGMAAGALYEDDGESPAYLDGDLAGTRFEAANLHGRTVVAARRSGGFDPGSRTVEVFVHGDGSPRRASVADRRSWEVVVA